MASRDLPHSFGEALYGWAKKIPQEVSFRPVEERNEEGEVKKVKTKNLWPAFVSGAGLFSDGYVNNSISTVTTCLSLIYGKRYKESRAISNIASIAFAGTIIGQLSFGYVSDNIARKGGMMLANILLILFTLLCAVATWGKTPEGMFTAITVFRFFLGIAIGAEYPTSSVIASEFANQLPPGHRNRYFCWFTNFTINAGFVVSAFVPLVLLWIFKPTNLMPVWRLTLGLGVFPPLALFFMRRKMKDSTSFQKLNMKKVKKYPLWLIIKFYWFRLSIVAIIWFIYNFSVYSFGLYSSFIFTSILPDGNIYKSWGWNVVFNLFYIPGSFLGALSADFLGPRLTLFTGLACQSIIGFGMTAAYPKLKHNIAGFVVVYGIFTTLGEFGPGNNVGLLASKTSATPIRGQYYGIAAATGKAGAFVGTYVFPIIIRKYGGETGDMGIRTAFYIASSMCLFSAFLALFLCPSVGQDSINKEDAAFVNYLEANGFDITQMGNQEAEEVRDLESLSTESERGENLQPQETSKDTKIETTVKEKTF